MKKGICIRKAGEYIEKACQNAGELALLARGDDVEVMTQQIKSKEVFVVEPYENSGIMEFCYILKGKVKYFNENESIVLEKGGYFYIRYLEKTHNFKALEDTTLLYVSSQSVFHFLSDTIKELNYIIEQVNEKDVYTRGHAQRVRDYSVKIAERLNLSKEGIDGIALSSLFHDIGKINTPDNVLNKPGRLTEEEMEIIKSHPIDGAEMLKKTYYENISEIVSQHHERIDGSGYPKGLKGDEIRLEAKIIAVADTFDAMTSNRPYRKALDPHISINELKKLVGKHYDNQIVEVFENILKEERLI